MPPADYLALAQMERDGSALRRLARSPYPFAWQALAANPHTPPTVLVGLSTARDNVWNDNKLLRLLAEHPAADALVLRAVLDAVAAKLEEGERPCAAAPALADRLELASEGAARLGSLRGPSARLRRGLTSRLDLHT